MGSYVVHGVTDREGFDAALRALFDAHARNGRLEFPYRSVALVFRVARERPGPRPQKPNE